MDKKGKGVGEGKGEVGMGEKFVLLYEQFSIYSF